MKINRDWTNILQNVQGVLTQRRWGDWCHNTQLRGTHPLFLSLSPSLLNHRHQISTHGRTDHLVTMVTAWVPLVTVTSTNGLGEKSFFIHCLNSNLWHLFIYRNVWLNKMLNLDLNPHLKFKVLTMLYWGKEEKRRETVITFTLLTVERQMKKRLCSFVEGRKSITLIFLNSQGEGRIRNE